MRKIYILIACSCFGFLLKAQTTNSVSFTFAADPATGNVAFTNTSVFQNNDVKKAFWTFGDSTAAQTAPTAGITHHYLHAGTYQVCLRVFKYSNSSNDSTLLGSECKSVTLAGQAVADSCAANFTFSATAANVLGRRFVAQPWHNNGKKPLRICWTFGDGKDTCLQYATSYTGEYGVEHQYGTYGSYEVCATIKYDGGCEKKKCNAITLTQPATVCSFDLNEVAVSAASLERKFYVGLMPNAVAQKVCWEFGDGTDTCVVLSNPLNAQQLMIAHRYPAPGNYTVCAKVTYTNGCTASRCRPVSITVSHSNVCGGYMTDSTISASTIRFKGTGIQNSSDYVVSYNWTFGDGASGSGQTVTHAFAAPGRYNVCLYLKTATGCETRICNLVNVLGNNQPQLVLTPNPVVNVLNATFVSLLQQTVTVKIYNANGLMIRSYVRAANVGTNNWSFSDVGTLATGVYSVIVQSANQFATAIFFKQ